MLPDLGLQILKDLGEEKKRDKAICALASIVHKSFFCAEGFFTAVSSAAFGSSELSMSMGEQLTIDLRHIFKMSFIEEFSKRQQLDKQQSSKMSEDVDFYKIFSEQGAFSPILSENNTRWRVFIRTLLSSEYRSWMKLTKEGSSPESPLIIESLNAQIACTEVFTKAFYDGDYYQIAAKHFHDWFTSDGNVNGKEKNAICRSWVSLCNNILGGAYLDYDGTTRDMSDPFDTPKKRQRIEQNYLRLERENTESESVSVSFLSFIFGRRQCQMSRQLKEAQKKKGLKDRYCQQKREIKSWILYELKQTPDSQLKQTPDQLLEKISKNFKLTLNAQECIKEYINEIVEECQQKREIKSWILYELKQTPDSQLKQTPDQLLEKISKNFKLTLNAQECIKEYIKEYINEIVEESRKTVERRREDNLVTSEGRPELTKDNICFLLYFSNALGKYNCTLDALNPDFIKFTLLNNRIAQFSDKTPAFREELASQRTLTVK